MNRRQCLQVAGFSLLIPLVGCGSSSTTAARTRAVFTEISDSSTEAIIPQSVSRDGSVVALNRGNRGYLWKADTGIVPLETTASSVAIATITGISDDGKTIIGYSDRAYRYTEAGGITVLADDADAAQSLSGNGRFVVGAINEEASLWTESGIVQLGFLPEHSRSRALCVSADGRTVYGVSESDDTAKAFVWKEADGMSEFGGFSSTEDAVPVACSDDGAFLVGNHIRGESTRGFRSVPGVPGLYPLYVADVTANDISGSGSIIVGQGQLTVGTPLAAVYYVEDSGPYYLKDYLQTRFAADVPENFAAWQLLDATAVSQDGRTIVGRGINPVGQEVAWRVRFSGNIQKP